MYTFMKSLFSLIGLFTVVMLVVVLWVDFSAMDPANGHYPNANSTVSAGEPISFESIDATPTGFAKRGYLLDLLLLCRTGRLSLEFFKWQFDIGKMPEPDVRLHKPQLFCKKRGLTTLF